MSAHIYKKIELTGTSKLGMDDAIQNAIAKASESLEHLGWFEVKETRGSIKEGRVEYWQVTIVIGFRLND